MEDTIKRLRIAITGDDSLIKAEEGNSGVTYDGIHSHNVENSELKRLLERTESGLWKSVSNEGREVGKLLYGVLNGSGGKLASFVDDSFNSGGPLHIYLKTGPVLSALPFELLHDSGSATGGGGRFLLRDGRIHIIRLVSESGWLSKPKIENRALKMVFMASSPSTLEETFVLNFEKEEDAILNAIGKQPVDVMFEDSGSVEGLKDSIHEFDGCDVVHITGHAGMDKNNQPVFTLEDEVGDKADVSPEVLWQALKDKPPRRLFLSGCETGKSRVDGSTESFAYQMAARGISVVLGWGMPVSDASATVFTGELYRSLAAGADICTAVSNGRNKLIDEHDTWPQLRIFGNGTRFTAITSENELRHHTPRAATVAYLQGKAVKVLTKGFVGRRREVRRCIRGIRGDDVDGTAGKYGAIIRGTAGNGKSCLAGKLIDRFKHRQTAAKELVAFHGEVDGTKIIGELLALFRRKGIGQAEGILKSAEIDYDGKIEELFRGPFMEVPTIIYFDDFEQNLQADGDDYVLTAEPLEAVRPILYALDWANHETVVLITSRYPFKLVVNDEDLPAKLEDIPLAAFKGADLKKKVEWLPNINESKHRKLYLKYGGGNPRLLEWFEDIAKDETQYDLDALEAAIKGKGADFIQRYLAGLIASTVGSEFAGFLCRAAVYRIPVEAGAFAGIAHGSHLEHLEKGVAHTLFEQERDGDGRSFYWGTPVIAESQWNDVGASERHRIHTLAFAWFEGEIGRSKGLNSKLREEAVHHGLECGNVRRAISHALTLGEYLKEIIRYRDIVSLFGKVADKIMDDVIKEAIDEKDEDVSRLLNNYGYILDIMGQYELAIEYYEKALGIDLAALGDKHPDVATRYNNIARTYYFLGQYESAIGYLEKVLDIDTVVFGEAHPVTQDRRRGLKIVQAAFAKSQKGKKGWLSRRPGK